MRVVLCDMMRQWRGGQRQYLILAEGLVRRGHDVLCILRRGSPLEDHLKRKRIAHEVVAVPFEADLSAALRIAALCRRFRAHIIHSHDSHAHWLAGLAALRMRLPHIVSRRVDFHIFRHGLGFSWFKYRYFADGYIAVSRAAADVLVRCGIPQEMVFIVPSGLPEKPPPKHQIREILGLPRHVNVVGTVGDLVGHKAHQIFVEAAARITDPNIHFVIIGEGPLRKALEKKVESLGLTGRFHMPGRREDAENLIGSFDIFVMSSVQEGLGTSVLDAYRHGVAVVATRAGGLKEVVRDGKSGLLVEPGDAEGLARAVELLLRDEPLRKRLALGGRELLKNCFSADIMVEKTEGVYRRFVGVSRRCYRRRT